MPSSVVSHPVARDLSDPVLPLVPATSCADVFTRLLAEPDLMHIPVVCGARPVGLVSRQDFMLVYVRMYGREVYGRSPITVLMNESPLVVDADTSCEDISSALFATEGNQALQGYIVTENGRYLGLGSAGTLMRVTGEIILARAEELEAQRRRAEAASESKTQFLAGMSHELRTPLNAIIGFADLMRLQLLGTMQPPRYLEYAQDIHGSGVHLLSMINELLDMAKIEATGPSRASQSPVQRHQIHTRRRLDYFVGLRERAGRSRNARDGYGHRHPRRQTRQGAGTF